MKKLLLLVIIVCVFTSFTHKELTWIAIGDSITYLNEHQDETGNRVIDDFYCRDGDVT